MAIETPTAAEPLATVFTLKQAPVLSGGRFDRVVAKSDDLSMRVKVYAEGGENVIHAHLAEDHVFLVLAGQATFHLGKDEKEVAVGQYEGVFLPKGAFYWFQSSGEENLVMFRVGAGARYDGDRMGADGGPLPGGSKENKHEAGVAVPGKFFGA